MGSAARCEEARRWELRQHKLDQLEARLDSAAATLHETPEWLAFVNIPLGAVPFMLEGYRDVALLAGDEQGTAEARILWRTLGSALDGMSGPLLPEQSWAERPLTNYLQLVRFLLVSNHQAWLRWLPNRW